MTCSKRWGTWGIGLALLALAPGCKAWNEAPEWDGRSGLQCAGSQVMHIVGRKIDTDMGPIFMAGGMCQLTLENCDIRGPEIASVGGNAQVVIKGSRITATNDMRFLNKNLAGHDPVAQAQLADQMVMQPGMAFFTGGNAKLTLSDTTVDARVGVLASGNSGVTLSGGRLQGREKAIDVNGNGGVAVHGTQVTGATAGASAGQIVGL